MTENKRVSISEIYPKMGIALKEITSTQTEADAMLAEKSISKEKRDWAVGISDHLTRQIMATPEYKLLSLIVKKRKNVVNVATAVDAK